MSARAYVSQRVQIGVETEAGTPVPATRRLKSINLAPSISLEKTRHRALGDKFDAQVYLGREWSELSVDGVPDYEELTYALAAVIGNEQVTEVEPGVFEHVFEPGARCADDVITLTVEAGDCAHAHRAAGATIRDLTLSWKRADGSTSLTGAGFGGRLDFDARLSGNEIQSISVVGGEPTEGAFTLTFGTDVTVAIPFDSTADAVQTALEQLPSIGAGNVLVTGDDVTTGLTVEFVDRLGQTDVPELVPADTFDAGTVTVTTVADGAEPISDDLAPIIPEHVTVYLDTDPEAIGTTTMETVHSVEWALTGRRDPVWYLRRGEDSYSDTVELAPDGTVKVLYTVDQAGVDAGIAFARTDATRYLRIEALGTPVGDTEVRTLLLDQAVQVESVGQFSDEGGVYAYEVTYRFIDAPGFGSVSATLVNGTPGVTGSGS